MRLNRLGRHGFLGVAACVLTLIPIGPSAQIDKCSQALTKSSAKVVSDVQKEMAKCVDGWLKTETKGKGHIKQAEKCQAGLIKIGLGADIGSDAKTKLGKAFAQLVDSFPGGAKAKCTDDDLDRLVVLNTSTFGTGDVGVRLSIMAAFARAWSSQTAINGETSRAIGSAADARCSLAEQVGCETTVHCDEAAIKAGGSAGGFGTCDSSLCPECADLSAPLNGADATCTPPSCPSVRAGPCWASVCRVSGTNEVELVSGTPFTTAQTPFGENPMEFCDVPEILPDAIGIISGPGKGLRYHWTGLTGPDVGVCVENIRGTGYIAKAAAVPALPSIDLTFCGDTETTGDDDCLGFTQCSLPPSRLLPDQGIYTNAKLCTSVAASPGSVGSSVFLTQQRVQYSLTTPQTSPFSDPCTANGVAGTSSYFGAPVEPQTTLLTTGSATGTLNDAGGGFSTPGPFDLTVTPFPGAPFDVAAAEAGTLIGAFAGATAFFPSNLAEVFISGAGMTKVDMSCVAP